MIGSAEFIGECTISLGGLSEENKEMDSTYKLVDKKNGPAGQVEIKVERVSAAAAAPAKKKKKKSMFSLRKSDDDDEEEVDEEDDEEESDGPQSYELPIDPHPKPFKAGDYAVSVTIHEVRDLVARDRSGTSDPVVKVKVGSESYMTSVRKKTNSALFNEMFNFDMHFKMAHQMDMDKISVWVYDSNSITKDVLIGMYEFEISIIYSLIGHELHETWLVLTDVTDEFEGPQGFAKVSVSVLGPGDEAVEHPPTELGQHDDLTKCLMPPKLDQNGVLVHFYVVKGQHLPQMDSSLGRIDPYMGIAFAGVNVNHAATGI